MIKQAEFVAEDICELSRQVNQATIGLIKTQIEWLQRQNMFLNAQTPQVHYAELAKSMLTTRTGTF